MTEANAQEAKRWRRRAEREKKSRLEAEAIAEKAYSALYASNTRLAAARQLAETETLYRELFAGNPIPLYVVARHSLQFLEVNAAAESCYGYERAEFLRMSLREIEPRAEGQRPDARAAGSDPAAPISGLRRHVASNGRRLDVELSIHTVEWADQPAWLIVAHDVTAQRHDQRMLELRTRAMDASHNGMFICSAREARYPVHYANAAMVRFCADGADTLVGRTFAELFEHCAAGEVQRMIAALKTGTNAQTVLAVAERGNDTRWLEAQVTPVPDDNGAFNDWIGVVQDITERKSFEAALSYRAHYDDLTGLPNRELLHQRLGAAIADAEQAGHEIAVLFLDLDGFKQINDRGGHEIGDTYLQMIAKRLRNRIRESDTLARVGGDEFVLVTRGPRLHETIEAFAKRLQEAFVDPVIVADQAFNARASIGIATYPADGDDAETLLQRADMTMYIAKRDGGQAVERFSLAEEARFRQRAEIEAGLARAIDQQAFELHYQPQLDMRSGAIVGMEALLRWPGADPAYRSPAVFIPVAEDCGLIGEIGVWVLDRACADLAELHAAGQTELTMAVNASAVQLRSPGFAQRVAAALGAHGLPAAALEIEITESVFMDTHTQSMQTLRALEALGVRLAIDDFGTGYSSLAYLSRLPVHRLKIDRSFIQGMSRSEHDSELVHTVTRMAQNLKLQALAEGVETAAERDTLLGHGCRLAQGYYYYPALPMPRLAELLEARAWPDTA